MTVDLPQTHQTTQTIKLVPVVRELSGDLDTPVSLYLKLAGQGPSFLLESVTGGEQVARYSFIGVHPRQAFVLRGQEIETIDRLSGSRQRSTGPANPMDALRAELARYSYLGSPGLPRFTGGLVGFLGYEAIRYFESSVEPATHPHNPDAVFLLADTLVAFDHAFGRVLLIANAFIEGDEKTALEEAAERLDEVERLLTRPVPHPGESGQFRDLPDNPLESNKSPEEFMAAVERAQEEIRAGEIFQVVLSQQLSRTTGAAPFEIYRALRRLNPSPYMFYFDFEELAGPQPMQLIGASPEMHVRLEGGVAAVRPIAGTRPRGKTPERDAALEEQLLADPKELAEHVMLVDLARNDLGRVCDYGSVHVREQMVVERYSHVMHIVSHVEGRLREGLDAFDLMQATFPAGTVSGAPKIRAMQIIAELEQAPRGPYAGAVG